MKIELDYSIKDNCFFLYFWDEKNEPICVKLNGPEIVLLTALCEGAKFKQKRRFEEVIQ